MPLQPQDYVTGNVDTLTSSLGESNALQLFLGLRHQLFSLTVSGVLRSESESHALHNVVELQHSDTTADARCKIVTNTAHGVYTSILQMGALDTDAGFWHRLTRSAALIHELEKLQHRQVIPC